MGLSDSFLGRGLGRDGFRRGFGNSRGASKRSAFDRPGLSPAPRIALGLLALAVLVVLAGRQVRRLTTEPVWITAAAVAPGTVLGPEHVRAERRPGSSLPESAVPGAQEILGRTVHRPVQPGQVLTVGDFSAPPEPRPKAYLSDAVPEGRVLFNLKVPSGTVPTSQLRRGDRLELLAADRAHGKGPSTRVVARDAFLVGTARSGGAHAASAPHSRLGMDTQAPQRQKKGAGPGGTYLLLALDPKDVLAVADAQGKDLPLAVVVHGRREIQAGRLLQLEPPPPAAAELISGGNRETVTFPHPAG